MPSAGCVQVDTPYRRWGTPQRGGGGGGGWGRLQPKMQSESESSDLMVLQLHSQNSVIAIIPEATNHPMIQQNLSHPFCDLNETKWLGIGCSSDARTQAQIHKI